MKTLLLLVAVTLLAMTGLAADKESRFFELRTYHAAAGKLDELNARFRDHTLKLFEAHGIVNIGYWMPDNNTNNLLIYMLAYPSREAREKSWKEFQVDPEWQAAKKASEVNGTLVDKVDSVYLTATDFSPVVTPSKVGEPRLFELRIYHAAPGKLDGLLARFRDHTVSLFNKHGLPQFGFWVPTEAKDGAGEKLIYILVHKDLQDSKDSFRAFGSDPEWNKARAESEANGPLTVPGGVTSQFMKPTDYSPTK